MIFVFGSNLAGIHSAGAAKYALKHKGAILYRGEGLYGQSYALPTKGYKLETLPLYTIRLSVNEFIGTAYDSNALQFQITRVGCGLAGYKDEDIAPMFKNCPKDNCFFDEVWKPYLGNDFKYWGTF